jgi:hypothetical protein
MQPQRSGKGLGPGVRDMLVALSLANVAYYKTWTVVLERIPMRPAAFVAAIVNTACLAALIWLGLSASRRGNRLARTAVRLFVTGLILLFAYGIGSVHLPDNPAPRAAVLLAATGLLGAVWLTNRWSVLYFVFLILSPFAALLYGQAFWRMLVPTPLVSRAAGMLPTGGSHDSRVVWLLFDEWDYALTFAERDQRLRTPALDRLRAHGFFATNAYPPGRTTEASVPTLMTGRPLTRVADIFHFTTIFGRARQAGYNSAIVGWFIPYCKALGSTLAECWTPEMSTERNSLGGSYSEIALNQARNLFETQFRSPFGQPLGAKRQYWDYENIAMHATQAAVDPRLQLVYVHYPVPHEPLFYDANRHAFDLAEKPVVAFFQKDFSRYVDALALVDRTVGELRASMQAGGVWDRTTLILTADHPYRNRTKVDRRPIDGRVPFLIKFPGDTEPLTYNGHLETAVTGDLLMAVLEGKIRNDRDCAAWLSRVAVVK